MKLCIHMKSGKTLTERFVKEWSLEYSGDDITLLSITKMWPFRNTIIMGSLSLSDIEAITKH